MRRLLTRLQRTAAYAAIWLLSVHAVPAHADLLYEYESEPLKAVTRYPSQPTNTAYDLPDPGVVGKRVTARIRVKKRPTKDLDVQPSMVAWAAPDLLEAVVFDGNRRIDLTNGRFQLRLGDVGGEVRASVERGRGDEEMLEITSRLTRTRYSAEEGRLLRVFWAEAKGAWKVSDVPSGPLPGAEPGPASGLLYFYIAYVGTEHDAACRDQYHRPCFQAFVDAANTWENEVVNNGRFRIGTDIFVRALVRTAGDFVNAWNDIGTEAARNGRKIQRGALFTHTSSLSLGWSTGLEFAPAPGEGAASTTISQDEIRALKVLPWIKDGGLLELHGCNSGVPRGLPLWSPASVFARTQKVATVGENGWAYFSKDPELYFEIDRSSSRIYLHAYPTGRNTGVSIPGGNRIPTITYSP